MATKNSGVRRAATADRSTAEPELTGESLNQVRDILFGGQIRAVESRLDRIEERFQREMEGNLNESTKRLEKLESSLKKDFESLAEKLAAERSSRMEELKSLTAELKRSIKEMNKQLTDLDKATTTADADLRDRILQHADEASQNMERVSSDLRGAMERETNELRTEKVDTASLVSILSDMVVRLTEDMSPPDQS